MTSQTTAGASTDLDLEQDKWLDDAVENTKKQAWFMKRALDNGDIHEALKYAVAMTDELRTSKLSPKNYYELYMDVTNELRDLELYFEEEDKADDGRSIIELYEHVQHAGNIIPRLYLLITVASIYIKSKKAPAKDILFDLVELCRGVQHPMRGLFLRNYLSQIAKDKLPDVGSEYEGFGGTVKDAIEFILQNFDNMNKLWVRMQHQGAVRDRQKREKERRNLRQLVGTNLVRLSELEGTDLATYKELVLPRLLEQIVNCKDVIAQEYLMDVIIQVFPDEFHLQTLEIFLGNLSQLQKKVNVKNIIITFMNRLSNFAKEATDSSFREIDMFPMFLKYSTAVIETNTKIPLEDILQLQVALVNFASSVYPSEIHFIDHVLKFSVQSLEKTGQPKVDKKCEKYVKELLTIPLDSLALKILQLNSYAALMAFLEFQSRKQVAVSIIEAIVRIGEKLDSLEKVDRLFQFISPVLKDQDDFKEEQVDEFEFDQEQTKAAQLFHLVHNDDTDLHFQLLVAVRKHYGQGGTKRIQHSLPALVYGSLALIRRVFPREQKDQTNESEPEPAVKTKKIFGFVHEVISVLSPHNADLALRLFLHASQAADTCGYEAISYEFVAQAFLVYEEEVTESKAQLTAINLIVASLYHLQCFGSENYDTLSTKATQHCAKLLKKPDQCRALINCAHLFWPGTDSDNNPHRDADRVLKVLQRALKIANGAVNHQVFLFVDILNKYLFFFEKGCPSIKVKFLQGLMALIEEHIPNLGDSEQHQAAKQHYQSTLLHIRRKQSLEDEVGERYRTINQNAEEEEASPVTATE